MPPRVARLKLARPADAVILPDIISKEPLGPVTRADDVAWDLYCGAGAIGLLAAPHVRRVVGVEIAPESIERARDNAERNGISNAARLHQRAQGRPGT